MLKAALIGFYDMRDGPWDVIKKISGFGYRALEHGGFLLKGDVKENAQKLADLNFGVLTLSSDIDGLKNNFGQIAENAHSIGVKNITCYWSDAQNYGEAAKIAENLNKAGENLRREGLYLCYHNHDHEFKKSFNGVKFFDILMALTSPENVFLNIDLGWATVGDGPDNVPSLIGRVKDRIRLTHFKDFYDLADRDSFTALGTGQVKIQELIAEIAKIGVEYITVEQDKLHNLGADDTVLASYLTLKESGLVL